ADFRARFGESFATLPGELKEEALRNLWLQLLRKCGPERPSIGYWSDFLFSHVPDGATEDLRYARLAIARYAVFRGGGGTVSAAVFGSVRNKVFGSASGAASSGASWSDKGFIARLRTVCTALAGSSAGAEPTELLDRLDSIFAENSRIMRLVEDDPERGFEILNALVMPLGAGLESPGGPPPPAWVPAFRARAVPQIAQLFSYPSGNPSCFWKGSPEAASRFGRILTEDAIGFYFARIPETAGMDAAERAACWRGLARNGAFLDAWAALEDGGVTPPDPGPGGYPGHGILKEGPPGRSALFLRLPRLLLADWSDGTTFVWTEGSHPSPAMRLPAYHYCDVVDHKSYSEIQRGPWWKAEITHALVLAGEVGLPGAGG
ncbi:MAG: hypothetical protein LBR80_09165, partial [Deltaproteobacteria bacterium]|nr:hypothetical protein [Deltaproteobacteria bacterium]